MMSFNEAIKTCFKKYFVCTGRATRAEYWWFQLFLWSVLTFCTFLGILTHDLDTVSIVIGVSFFTLTLVPNFCVSVRRLHDTGWSGYTYLWCLLSAFLGLIIINIRNMFPSDDDNEYGPNPFMQKKLKEAQMGHNTDISVKIEDNNISQNKDAIYIPHGIVSEESEDTSKPVVTTKSINLMTMDANANNVISQENEHSQVRYCSFCGKKVVNKDAVYCKECGKKL